MCTTHEDPLLHPLACEPCDAVRVAELTGASVQAVRNSVSQPRYLPWLVRPSHRISGSPCWTRAEVELSIRARDAGLRADGQPLAKPGVNSRDEKAEG